jgi:hypothetical protein
VESVLVQHVQSVSHQIAGTRRESGGKRPKSGSSNQRRTAICRRRGTPQRSTGQQDLPKECVKQVCEVKLPHINIREMGEKLYEKMVK